MEFYNWNWYIFLNRLKYIFLSDVLVVTCSIYEIMYQCCQNKVELFCDFTTWASTFNIAPVWTISTRRFRMGCSRILCIDQQKVAWFESDLCVSCASYMVTLLQKKMSLMSPHFTKGVCLVKAPKTCCDHLQWVSTWYALFFIKTKHLLPSVICLCTQKRFSVAEIVLFNK